MAPVCRRPAAAGNGGKGGKGQGAVFQRPAGKGKDNGKGGKGHGAVFQRPAGNGKDQGKGKGQGKGKDQGKGKNQGKDKGILAELDWEFEVYLRWVEAGRPLPEPLGSGWYDYLTGESGSAQSRT
jgi:hypothetical protein